MNGARGEPFVFMQIPVWHFIRPWLKSPQASVEKFWSEFKSEEAQEGRLFALYGTKWTNRLSEQRLLGVIREYRALLPKENQLHQGPDGNAVLLAEAITRTFSGSN